MFGDLSFYRYEQWFGDVCVALVKGKVAKSVIREMLRALRTDIANRVSM